MSLIYSKATNVVENCISEARRGIYLHASQNNSIFHNNFINNTLNVEIDTINYNNSWDNGIEGNYWSDYIGVDSNKDGIGDQSHPITQGPGTPPELMQYDNRPLKGRLNSYNVTYFKPPLVPHFCRVTIISNSTVSAFVAPIWIEHPEVIFLQFNVTGEEGSTGFCRVSFPTAMMNSTYHVSVNDTEIPFTLLSCSDANMSYLYFTYTHSTQEVIIVQEFSSFIILPLFVTATLIAALTVKRKLKPGTDT
jgi:parallel beta-helix repeat protein